jgi:hypothetical protein
MTGGRLAGRIAWWVYRVGRRRRLAYRLGKVRTMGVDEHPEHERHPEGGGGADLGHVHDAIEEEGEGEGPGLAGYRDHEHQAHPEGGGGADLGHVHDAIEEER